MSLCSAFNAPPTRIWVLWPERMRARAVCSAEMPAPSSPMKVREEPVTLWTMEMLPASKLDKLRQKQRGAQFCCQLFIEHDVAVIAGARGIEDLRIDSHITLAAAGSDDHVHRGGQFLIFADACVLKGKACSVGAEALPWLHLALLLARAPSGFQSMSAGKGWTT